MKPQVDHWWACKRYRLLLSRNLDHLYCRIWSQFAHALIHPVCLILRLVDWHIRLSGRLAMDILLPCDSLSGLSNRTCWYQKLGSYHQWRFRLSISSVYQDKLMSNILLDPIYVQLFLARWRGKKSANLSVALSTMVWDLCRCVIWSTKKLMIIDIEYFVEIGGNNCAVWSTRPWLICHSTNSARRTIYG